MGPRSKPRTQARAPLVLDKAHPCWADVRAGLEEAERSDTIALTDDEADAWAKTGELPKRVYQWHDERSSSRRGT
jgi:hypothetical protein